MAVVAGRRLAGAREAPLREVFLDFVYPLVPLGLLAWVAFSLPLVLVNGSYILMVASDPFGWGWDLFGTAHVAWSPIAPHWTPYLQVPLLITGLGYALKTGYRHSRSRFSGNRQAILAFSPVAVLLAAFVSVFLFLYVG